MLEKIIESFPAGTSETAGKLLVASMNVGDRLGDRISEAIDSIVDHVLK